MSNKKKKLLIMIVGAVLLLATSIITSTSAQEIAYPDNVENLTVVPGDKSVTLKWDIALDAEQNEAEKYKIYYGLGSALTDPNNYNFPPVLTDDNTPEYTLYSLNNGTTYYFSVVAVDKNNIESEFYSNEISATPIAAAKKDEKAPEVVSAEAVDINHVEIVFNEKIVLPEENPETAFTITEQISTNNLLEVVDAELDDENLKKVILETEDQEGGQNYVITVGVALQDLAGNNVVSGVTDTAVFEGTEIEPLDEEVSVSPENTKEPEPAQEPEFSAPPPPPAAPPPPPPDTTPPEDITNLLLSFRKELNKLNKYVVIFSWTASINSANDLIDQLLYTSFNKGTTYSQGKSLGASAIRHEESNMEGGKEYTFKITTKDNSGNESVGVIKSIRLPQSGAPLVLPFTLAAVVVFGYTALKRKKRSIFH